MAIHRGGVAGLNRTVLNEPSPERTVLDMGGTIWEPPAKQWRRHSGFLNTPMG